MSTLLRLALCASLACALTVSASAASADTKNAGGLGSLSTPKGEEPIDFSSDAGYVDEANHTVVLSGHVIAQQGSMKLQADNIVAHYLSSGQNSNPANATNGKIESLEAAGNVVVTRPGEVVKAVKATYKMLEKQILMHGNVVATRGQNVVSGDSLIVDLVKESIRLEAGSSDGRVHGIFAPPANDKAQ